MATVEHELFGTEAAEAGYLIEAGGVFDEGTPIGGRVGVDLDHARVRGDFDLAEAMVEGWGVAFDENRELELGCGVFDGVDELDILFGTLDGRHEDMEFAAAWLDGKRGADGGVGTGGESLLADLLAYRGGFTEDGALGGL
jgi:hypothetical protein